MRCDYRRAAGGGKRWCRAVGQGGRPPGLLGRRRAPVGEPVRGWLIPPSMAFASGRRASVAGPPRRRISRRSRRRARPRRPESAGWPGCRAGMQAVAEAEPAAVATALGLERGLLLVGEAVVEGLELGEETLHQVETEGVVADLGGETLDRVGHGGLRRRRLGSAGFSHWSANWVWAVSVAGLEVVEQGLLLGGELEAMARRTKPISARSAPRSEQTRARRPPRPPGPRALRMRPMPSLPKWPGIWPSICWPGCGGLGACCANAAGVNAAKPIVPATIATMAVVVSDLHVRFPLHVGRGVRQIDTLGRPTWPEGNGHVK